jgi:hypothetical protein
VIRQRQLLKRQSLSKPGLWLKRLRRGRRRGDERGTPPDYGAAGVLAPEFG